MTEPDGSRRCWRCGRKLAELLTPPYYLQCGKCKARNREIPVEQVEPVPEESFPPGVPLQRPVPTPPPDHSPGGGVPYQLGSQTRCLESHDDIS